MKNLTIGLFMALLCISSVRVNAQFTDTTHYNYGIWQSFGGVLSSTTYPQVRGRTVFFNWKDIETAPNVWKWTDFDQSMANKAKDGLPFIFMIYTKDAAPDWLYANGVPKVTEKDASGAVTGSSPYYADPTYKTFFKRMITMVRQHVETLPASTRNQVVGVQGCFGSTGDYISYKGTVPAQYNITDAGFFELFKEFSQHYYDEYKNTTPKIYLLSNPWNKGSDQTFWLLQNCPGGWIKFGTLGKGYQMNDEKTKAAWLFDILNSPQSGNFIRCRSENTGAQLSSGWWTKIPYRNMFALMCYGIHWGLDWNNQGVDQIKDALNDSAYRFFNKYAGQKDPLKSTNAMCALKDVLDASDAVRFPASAYGSVAKTASRFKNILAPFVAYGAKLEDTNNAILHEQDNIKATGINDVGWDLFPGNYERYLRQINANATSAGYWNVQSSDVNTMYGRFARGFDLAKGKDALYFDVENAWLNNMPLNSSYPVTIEITYLDSGNGSWQLFYDAQINPDQPSITITCANTGKWKKSKVVLSDAYFGNRGATASDFYIKSTNSQNVIFSVVELSRPNVGTFQYGLFTSALPSFDTVCVNSTSAAKSFQLSGAVQNSSDIQIGPALRCLFSFSANGSYTDSLVMSTTPAAFNKTVYIKFQADSEGYYEGIIPITNSTVAAASMPYSATVLSTGPSLSAMTGNVTCNGAKNGYIDLTVTGGIGPFTYKWTNLGAFQDSSEDVIGIGASTYTVVVTSAGGCTVSASYLITRPDPLVVNLSSDPMTCKGGTTNVYVSATGGILPYSGTGTFNAGTGAKTFTVTDGNNCTASKSITVADGTGTAPAKPGAITGANADASGVCGAGDFVYSISAVSTATAYNWTTPAGIIIKSTNPGGTSVALTAQASFTSGTLSVKAVNGCGSSAATNKSISNVPAKPASISGPATVAANKKGVVYSTPSLAGLSYKWTKPGGATIKSGQGTASITVDFGTNSGQITVTASNSCTSSITTALAVTVTSSLAATGQSALTAAPILAPSNVYPNPAKNIANVSFTAERDSRYTIEVRDITGKIVHQKQGFSSKGTNNTSIDVSRYTSGMYLIKLIYDTDEIKTFKLVKE